MGLKVLPPDVNDSDRDFTPRGTDIRFGLGAIRNVGANVVDSLVGTRKAKGRFADFADFLRKERRARVSPVTLAAEVPGALSRAVGVQLLPGTEAGTDGFHYACVEKTTDGT